MEGITCGDYCGTDLYVLRGVSAVYAQSDPGQEEDIYDALQNSINESWENGFEELETEDEIEIEGTHYRADYQEYCQYFLQASGRNQGVVTHYRAHFHALRHFYCCNGQIEQEAAEVCSHCADYHHTWSVNRICIWNHKTDQYIYLEGGLYGFSEYSRYVFSQ